MDVTIEIQYLTGSKAGSVTLAAAVKANSRRSFHMGDAFSEETKAGIVVRCLTSRKKILVERSMYWNSRGAGTDAIGGYSD